jgi:hypothetical protein
MFHMLQLVGGILAIKEAFETLPGGQIYTFVISYGADLATEKCPLSHGLTYVNIS